MGIPSRIDFDGRSRGPNSASGKGRPGLHGLPSRGCSWVAGHKQTAEGTPKWRMAWRHWCGLSSCCCMCVDAARNHATTASAHHQNGGDGTSLICAAATAAANATASAAPDQPRCRGGSLPAEGVISDCVAPDSRLPGRAVLNT